MCLPRVSAEEQRNRCLGGHKAICLRDYQPLKVSLIVWVPPRSIYAAASNEFDKVRAYAIAQPFLDFPARKWSASMEFLSISRKLLKIIDFPSTKL